MLTVSIIRATRAVDGGGKHFGNVNQITTLHGAIAQKALIFTLASVST
jgi:hypothetical protein